MQPHAFEPLRTFAIYTSTLWSARREEPTANCRGQPIINHAIVEHSNGARFQTFVWRISATFIIGQSETLLCS